MELGECVSIRCVFVGNLRGNSAIGYGRVLLLLKGSVCRIGWQMIVGWFLTDWLKLQEQCGILLMRQLGRLTAQESVTVAAGTVVKFFSTYSRATHLLLGMSGQVGFHLLVNWVHCVCTG